jgi:hypothetical protein
VAGLCANVAGGKDCRGGMEQKDRAGAGVYGREQSSWGIAGQGFQKWHLVVQCVCRLSDCSV